MSRAAFPYLAVTAQTIAAAATFLVAKVGVGQVTPAQLFSLRVLTTAPFLALILWRFGRRFTVREHLHLALLGLLGVPMNQGLFLWGLEYTSPTHSALMYALTPLFVALAARLMLGERLGARKAVGIALGFGGVALVLAGQGQGLSAGAVRGDLLILAAVVGWALYSVLGKPLVERHEPLVIAAASLLYGTAISLPVEIWALSGIDPRALTASLWGVVLFLALVTSIASYVLWYYALRHLPAGRVAIFTNLQPVLTAALSVALLGEALTGNLVGGGVIALMGVVIVQRA